MAELHEALTYLSPVLWEEVPLGGIEEYLRGCFTAGELICNSVPPLADGTPFNASNPHHRMPDSATSHKDMHPSTARSQPPHSDHEALQKNWGKPMKFKDNPLKVGVYKMAGHDRHGAWFARRSVTEGLGFEKFKRAMMREFAESMQVAGGPGAGAIRGIAADRRLERNDVPGLGKLEVYELSAQFPGPVTPRDFLTLLLSSDAVLSDKSAAHVENGTKHVPRHFMIVSRPVEHPDAPLRSGFVRGHYESVELIREVPLSTAKAKSTSDLLNKPDPLSPGRERGRSVGPTESNDQGSSVGADDPELNPVEWIMITRSDPGGGIPRFLVDRGTPETMIADVNKFFDWACAQDHILHPDEETERKLSSPGQAGSATDTSDKAVSGTDSHIAEPQGEQRTDHAKGPSADQKNPSGGIFANLTQAVGASFEAYAPSSVSNMVHQRLNPGEESESDSSDTSSIASFMSAEEVRDSSGTPAIRPLADSADTLSIASGERSDAMQDAKLSQYDKEVQKLVKKREKLDQQLAKKRLAEEQKFKQSQEKEQTDFDKNKEKMEMEIKRTEERHKKEVEKLEAKRAKEARKVEEKRKKKDEQNKMSLVTRERDDFRSQTDLFRKENAVLRDQVAELQSQNTRLTAVIGRLGGPEALKGVADGHQRSMSVLSSKSASASSDSVTKSLEKQTDGGIPAG